METFFVIVAVIIVIGAPVIMVMWIIEEAKMREEIEWKLKKERAAFNALPKEEQEAEKRRKQAVNLEWHLSLKHGAKVPQIICPLCQVTGQVRRKNESSSELVLSTS